ncbi:MAG TPA: O-succinylhomoserine sulfhydrylase [Alphaproteobacteria bacterium]|nr:O-succinylhomoserine sulfhydrylase [Alphaproteobacteria bacterium]
MSDESARSGLKPKTLMVHGGVHRSQFGETDEALFMTSGYVYTTAEEAESAFVNEGSRYVYSRFRNPTVAMFEDRLAAFEGAPRCFGTATGMSAVFAALACDLKVGDRIVAPYALFGSCLNIIRNILPNYGATFTMVDGTNLDEWRKALSTPARFVFLESPANPCLDIVDIQAVSDLAHKAGALVVVDNVFATPIFQKPFTLGADIVVYSATKHIDGQGRSLGGAVLCSDAFAQKLHPFLRHTGPTMSPFNGWLLLKGLETLDLRVRAQSQTAHEIARMLEANPAIERIRYPGLESHPHHALAKRQMGGFGNLITFDVKGGKEGAFAVLNRLKLILISNNLGDSKSLITHPATTTHAKVPVEDKQRVGINPGTIRLSVGLEDAGDLTADLREALSP